NDAFAGRQPLNIARTIAGGRAKRVGMIRETLTHHGYRFESTVRMLRKTRHEIAVIHPPAVLTFEILTDVPSGKRRGRTQMLVAGGIGILMIHAEQKRIGGLPREAQR